MVTAVLLAVFLAVVATTSSQPTYEEQQFCDGVCHQDDLQALQSYVTFRFTAIKNELSQLKEQVGNLLQIFSGYGGSTDNGTTCSFPTSPSGYRALL